MLKILLALLALILASHAEEAPLRTLAAVRALPREEAAKGMPVEIVGTVIFVDPREPGMIVHDGTASCWFGGKTPFPDEPKPGSRVRATGRTSSISYFPDVARVVQPDAGHPLREVGGFQQPVHDPRPGGGRSVREKSIQLGRSRRKPRHHHSGRKPIALALNVPKGKLTIPEEKFRTWIGGGRLLGNSPRGGLGCGCRGAGLWFRFRRVCR